MGKRKNHIETESGVPPIVLGLASNERIWKLCWEINQALNLNISAGTDDGSGTPARDIYADTESDPKHDYFLLENNAPPKKLSAKAKTFRFFLVVRPIEKEEFDLKTLLNPLSEIDIVSLAVDLSAEKDINKFIP